MVILFIALVYV
jgi:hypothetical protein